MGARKKGAPREPGICRLNRIRIEDNGEPLVNIREFCTGIVVKANPSLLRRTVAEMLQKAQDTLPTGYCFRVHTALRTYEMQSKGYWKHFDSVKEKHPEWPLSILRREVNKFYHPPDVTAPPGHTTGGAVDVNLLGPDGEKVDVTSTIREGIDANPTWVRGLTTAALANRQILITAMSGAGFSNCADEWWHWSYGDNGWAARVRQTVAFYGAVFPSEEAIAAATVIEPETEKSSEEASAQKSEQTATQTSERTPAEPEQEACDTPPGAVLTPSPERQETT